jgi:hypothetical protein
MKKRMKKIVFAVFGLLVFFAGCEKTARHQDSGSFQLKADSIAAGVTKDEIYAALLKNGVPNPNPTNVTFDELLVGRIIGEQIKVNYINPQDLQSLKNICINNICFNNKVGKDQIVNLECADCYAWYRQFFNLGGGLYLVYNNKEENGQSLSPDKQLMYIDYPYALKSDPSKKRAISIAINPTPDGSLIIYANAYRKEIFGITVTLACEPMTGGPHVCGCCEAYYPHWWSLSRNCDCNLASNGQCSWGACYFRVTTTIVIGSN